MSAKGRVFAVVLVGGKGKRLRPLSTNKRPKAFLSVTRDRKTMFKVTLDRIRKIIPPGNILISANRAHRGLIKRDFAHISEGNLILEPVSRNTAPAIALAAALLMKRDKGAVMVVVPADQHVLDEQKYLTAIKTGVAFAQKNDSLVVLGLKPTYPATGFGYIKLKGKGAKLKTEKIYKVEKFTEKPDLKTAATFIKDGRYFWNAGAFVFRAGSILRAIKKFAPKIFNSLQQLDKNGITKLYKKFPDISIDFAVMEHADNIYCVRGSYRWRDIGSFEVLKEVLKRESRDFVMKGEKVVKIL